MMLPTKVQLKFQRRDALLTWTFAALGLAGVEKPADSGVAEFICVPSFGCCWSPPFAKGVGPGKPGSGEDIELEAELIGAPE
jgi:hypothetical protein